MSRIDELGNKEMDNKIDQECFHTSDQDKSNSRSKDLIRICNLKLERLRHLKYVSKFNN